MHIPDGLSRSPAVAIAGVCVWHARLEVTEHPLPLAGLAVVVSVIAAALFTIDYALRGAAGLPLRTVALVIVGVFALIGLSEDLVTALVVRGALAARVDVVQVARG